MNVNDLLNKAANDIEKETLRNFFKNHTNPTAIQYFDVKLVIDRTQDFRARVKSDIDAIRSWKATYYLQRDFMARVILVEEGANLMIRLWSSWNAYRTVQSMAAQMREEYLKSVMRG
jgi:hypothetical protein